jgi:hypothetical protein
MLAIMGARQDPGPGPGPAPDWRSSYGWLAPGRGLGRHGIALSSGKPEPARLPLPAAGGGGGDGGGQHSQAASGKLQPLALNQLPAPQHLEGDARRARVLLAARRPHKYNITPAEAAQIQHDINGAYIPAYPITLLPGAAASVAGDGEVDVVAMVGRSSAAPRQPAGRPQPLQVPSPGAQSEPGRQPARLPLWGPGSPEAGSPEGADVAGGQALVRPAQGQPELPRFFTPAGGSDGDDAGGATAGDGSSIWALAMAAAASAGRAASAQPVGERVWRSAAPAEGGSSSDGRETSSAGRPEGARPPSGGQPPPWQPARRVLAHQRGSLSADPMAAEEAAAKAREAARAAAALEGQPQPRPPSGPGPGGTAAASSSGARASCAWPSLSGGGDLAAGRGNPTAPATRGRRPSTKLVARQRASSSTGQQPGGSERPGSL